MDEYIEVHWTAPTMEEARKVAKYTVEQKLAACVQLIPHVESHYVWQGVAECGQEIKVVFKTRKTRFYAVREAILQLGSYEVPEVTAVPIIMGHTPYLHWLKDGTH